MLSQEPEAPPPKPNARYTTTATHLSTHVSHKFVAGLHEQQSGIDHLVKLSPKNSRFLLLSIVIFVPHAIWHTHIARFLLRLFIPIIIPTCFLLLFLLLLLELLSCFCSLLRFFRGFSLLALAVPSVLF